MPRWHHGKRGGPRPWHPWHSWCPMGSLAFPYGPLATTIHSLPDMSLHISSQTISDSAEGFLPFYQSDFYGVYLDATPRLSRWLWKTFVRAGDLAVDSLPCTCSLHLTFSASPRLVFLRRFCPYIPRISSVQAVEILITPNGQISYYLLYRHTHHFNPYGRRRLSTTHLSQLSSLYSSCSICLPGTLTPKLPSLCLTRTSPLGHPRIRQQWHMAWMTVHRPKYLLSHHAVPHHIPLGWQHHVVILDSTPTDMLEPLDILPSQLLLLNYNRKR